ncbi:hypothetical protein HW555_003538, partial [Spodoptera exigua]
DAFLANEESLRQTNAYLEIYRERDRQLENAFAQVHAFQILEHAEPMELDHEEEVPYLPMNEDQFSQAKQSMNAGQKEIFTLVTQSIQNQMRSWCGQDFLLKLLRDQNNRCYANDPSEHLQPATHLWRLFTLCELTENMRQQGDHTFIDILNALRVGELRTQHFSILMRRLLQDTSHDMSLQ